MKVDTKGQITKKDRMSLAISNRNTYYDADRKDRTKTADTIHRREVAKFIKNAISQGKGKVEILVALIQKYPDSPVRPYFMQYIEHHLTKTSQTIDDEKER